MSIKALYLLVPLAPLIGALIAGFWGTKLFGNKLPRAGAHWVAILGVAVSFVASVFIYLDVMKGNTFNGTVYTWLESGPVTMQIGFLIDSLTVMMMLVVTFVSLMVHIYTVGYMEEDPGYARFFSYIALFTFSMLMLVMSNNFLQLFFGWEAVGLVSYLLIGFWYDRDSAIFANLKAFLVNRVGDFGFLLGIGLIVAYTGSLDYKAVFDAAPGLASTTIPLLGSNVSLMTAICIGLFIGAMGKSAQVPLHVWLPDSMEGPTPISALIHAATMVTAGIFMVARMSPLFELSETALTFVVVIGSITALFMGFLGIIQNDIKRVVAYSTLSQLGYMTVALGVSAYSAAVFHLMTHAFFKALLFLAAGSVIIGMHHQQDIRKMGGLRKYMPITWITSLIGSLALIGTPGFAGFFSKDSIIEAVYHSQIPGAGFAYFCVVVGVFVTAFYSFRMYFLVFHGKERFDTSPHEVAGHGDHGADAHGRDDHHGGPPHETPWVVTVPLILLAIPSVFVGAMTIGPMLFGNFFKGVVFVSEKHDVLGEMGREFHGWLGMTIHGLTALPFWLAAAGVALAWFFYLRRPDIPEMLARRFSGLYTLLDNKYYFDRFNQWFFAGGARELGSGLAQGGDRALIDGVMVNGSAKAIGFAARMMRHLQTGYVYHYAFAMLVGAVAFLTWSLRRM